MDSSNAPDTQQTANTSLFDEDNFDFFTDLVVVGQDDNKADTSDGRNTDPLDDLFDFCSLPCPSIQPVPVKDESNASHPDLLIDIGESDFSILSPEPVLTDNLLEAETFPEVSTEQPKKIDSMEQEIESSWSILDTGSDNDPFFEDMLFGDGVPQRKSSSSQQVPDILVDDLFSVTPDLIHSHEAKMDEADNDDILGCSQEDGENVNNNGLPNKKRDSAQSSDTNKESSRSSADFDDDLDFSVIQDTSCLDIDAVKQKTSLRKRGSLALRKKPTRSSMKRVVSQSEETRFIDSTEPKLPAVNGVEDDDDDEEVFKKSRTKPPGGVALPNLCQINKPKAPRGAFAPSLSQINKSKVLTGSPKKAGSSGIKKETSISDMKKDTDTGKSFNNNAQMNETEIQANRKPVVTASIDTPAASATNSSKPKLVFASQSSGHESFIPKLKPVSTSKPKIVDASKSGTKPKVQPRSFTKKVSKDQKETQNQVSAGTSFSTDVSLEREFSELATRIEQSEDTTMAEKPTPTGTNENDSTSFESSLSPVGFKLKNKSSTSSDAESTTQIKKSTPKERNQNDTQFENILSPLGSKQKRKSSDTSNVKCDTSSTPVQKTSTVGSNQNNNTEFRSLDKKFNELATRIEHTEDTTPVKKPTPTERKQNDSTSFKSILSPVGSKLKNKSSTSSDTQSTTQIKKPTPKERNQTDTQFENILSPLDSKQKSKSSDSSNVKCDTSSTPVQKTSTVGSNQNNNTEFRSLDRKFNELATRIEHSEDTTPVNNPTSTERKQNDGEQFEKVLSLDGSNKSSKSSTSSDTSNVKPDTSTTPIKKPSPISFDTPSLHKVNGDQPKAPLRKVSFDEMSSKPKHQAEIVKPLQKVSLKENKLLHDEKSENSCNQPSWATKKLKSTDDISKKMIQEQKPEKPAWFKAAQEKKARAAEIVIAQENRNQENSARIDESEEIKLSPWLGERQLRKTVKPKPLTENNDNSNGMNTSQTSHQLSNNNEENMLQTSNDADRLSPLKSVRKEPSTSPISPGKDDYVPSWMRGNKLKSVSTPNLHNAKGSSADQVTSPVSPSSTGEIPQWKKELVNRKKTKWETDAQGGSNKEDTSQEQSPGVMWKLQQTKKRQPVNSKAEMDKHVAKEPEWKRAAEEKRTRFLKSGMIEQ